MSVKSQLVSFIQKHRNTGLLLENTYFYCMYSIKAIISSMLGTEYFLKIAKINSQQEKPIGPNCKNKFPQDTKNCQSAEITSHKNFVPHGILLEYKICVTFYYD